MWKPEDFKLLDEFEEAYDKDDNEWWRLDAGDQMNLFDLLRQSRDIWRDQVVVIRAQQRAALARADQAEAALHKAATYCARPDGVCLAAKDLS